MFVILELDLLFLCLEAMISLHAAFTQPDIFVAKEGNQS